MTTPTPPSAMAVQQAFQLCKDLRCSVTTHLVGTDTWAIGYWCQCDSCGTVQRIARALSERDEQIEVGHQLTGSFFEALKPLNLTHVNVVNPGQHVTDLIAQLRERERELACPDDPARSVAAMLSRMSLEDRQAFNFCVKASSAQAEREVERLREGLRTLRLRTCMYLSAPQLDEVDTLLTRRPAPEAAP